MPWLLFLRRTPDLLGARPLAFSCLRRSQDLPRSICLVSFFLGASWAFVVPRPRQNSQHTVSASTKRPAAFANLSSDALETIPCIVQAHGLVKRSNRSRYPIKESERVSTTLSHQTDRTSHINTPTTVLRGMCRYDYHSCALRLQPQ